MLKTILSISGKPGLFKLVSQGKNALIVESLLDGKKAPAHSRDKVISLNDIAIYTEEGEKPLREVFQTIFEMQNGQPLTVDVKNQNSLRAFFAEVLPTYERDRVYPADIKKVVSWYNLLLANNLTDFVSQPEAETEASVAE